MSPTAWFEHSSDLHLCFDRAAIGIAAVGFHVGGRLAPYAAHVYVVTNGTTSGATLSARPTPEPIQRDGKVDFAATTLTR